MKFLLMMVGAVALPAFAADLQTSDLTGVSFWLVTAAMLAATVFFFVERDRVHGKWKTSLSVAGLVTGVAFWHYLYMRGVWVETGSSPTVYRYIDWLITVPLQIIEFYLILKVCTNVSSSVFLEAFRSFISDACSWFHGRNWFKRNGLRNSCNTCMVIYYL